MAEPPRSGSRGLSPSTWIGGINVAPGVLPSWEREWAPAADLRRGDGVGECWPRGIGQAEQHWPDEQTRGGGWAGVGPGAGEGDGWKRTWLKFTDMDLAPWGERPLGSAPVVMDLVGPLQEAQEAELGAGSGIASPDHGARQLLPELLPYTHKYPPKRSPPQPCNSQ
jgi:hypothetical protein